MTSPAWLARVPYHGMAASEFAHLGRSDGRNPSGDGWAAKEYRGHDRRDGHGLMGSSGQPNRKRRTNEGENRPERHAER